MATLTVQAITRDGVQVTYAAADGAGDKVKAGDRTFITVRNGDAAAVTVTMAVPGDTVYGVAKPTKDFVVAAGEDMDIPVLTVYGDSDDGGLASWTYDSATSVSVAARRI